MPTIEITTSSGFNAEIVNVTPPGLKKTYLMPDLLYKGGDLELHVEVEPPLPKVGEHHTMVFRIPPTKISHSFNRRTIPAYSHKKTAIKRYKRKAKPYYWHPGVNRTIETIISSVESKETKDGVSVGISHVVINSC